MASVLITLQDGRPAGTERRVAMVAGELIRRGHRVVVAIPLHGAIGELLRADGIPVEEVPYLRIRKTVNFFYHLLWLLSVPVTAAALARVIRKYRVEIVYDNQITQIQSGLAARLTGRRLIWHLIGLHWPRLLEKALFPFVRSWSDAIVVSAEANGRRLREWHHYRGEYHVIHAPVDISRFRPAASPADRAFRAELNSPDDELLVGLVCHINRAKGVEVFVDAAAAVTARHKGVRFVVVGPSVETQIPYLRGLLDQRLRLGLEGRVVFVGGREDIPNVLRGFDVFVLSSRSESSPLAVLEAMATGLAVVASDVGGVGEIIEDGRSGILCAVGDSAAFAAAISSLVEDPARRRELGREARLRVEQQFTVARAADRVERVLKLVAR